MTAIDTLLAQPFVARVGWALLHSVWEIAALAAVAAVALRALRRSSPASRYLASCAAMFLMVAAPGVTAWLAGPDEGWRGGPEPAALTIPPGEPARGESPPPRPEPGKEAAPEAPPVTPTEGVAALVAPLLPTVAAAWAAGVLVLSARLLGGWLFLQRLARRGTRPVFGPRGEALDRLRRRMAVGRPVRLLESTSARVPMVLGWLRPIILMPVAAMTGLSVEQFAAILAHELAHVRRLDYLVNLAQSVAETLLFYHPAVWWLGRRIREEREHCCDDQAVAACGDGLVYAGALAAMEELRAQPWALAPSAAGKPLLARIRRLLAPGPAADRPAGGLAGLVALATVAGLGLALVVAPGARAARAEVDAGPSIAGVVVDAGGAPAADADVWLVDASLVDADAVVLGRTRSGADGRFRVDRKDVASDGTRRGRLVLWAHRPGSGASRAVLMRDSSSPEPAEPARLVLEPPAEAALRVLDPEGRPVAGAVVAPIYLQGDLVHLPEELAERLGSTTGPAGLATMQGVTPGVVEMVRVASPPHGVQVGHFRKGLKPGTDLRLLPVARVDGRVSAADPASARGRKVLLSTYPRDRSKGEVYGRAEATTDEAGRFSVPALAAGVLNVNVPMPEGSPDRALRPSLDAIEGPGRAEVEIPLKRLVSVRGVVREKGDGRPVADATVRLSSQATADPNGIPATRTDAEGRFVALALPGPAGLYVNPPPAFLRSTSSAEVAIGEADGQALPPIEVERGATLRGRVVDETGSPVPGAAVEGKWQQQAGPGPNGSVYMMTPTAKATADARGEFLLEGIHPGAEVALEARAGDARTDRPQPGRPGAADPVTLQISGANTVALSGRVVDPAGRPVAGARVRLRSRPAGEHAPMEPGYVQLAGSEVLRSGPDGTYRTPRQLRRGYGYSAEGEADGRLSSTSAWLMLDPSAEPTLPDLVLPGLRTVGGRVVDDRGRPVAGAVVRVPGDAPTPVRVSTDERGRFSLGGIVEGPAFLFVETPGYRFQGRMIGPEAGDVAVALEPVDGPPPGPLATLPPALTRAEELALIHRVLDPYADAVLSRGAKEGRWSVLPILVRIDPARVLELLGREGFADPATADGLRGELAARLIREQPDEALALIEAIRDPSGRSYAAAEAAGGLPAGERALKLDLLGRALIAARAVAEPADRAIRYATIGEQYFDLGEFDRATGLLMEAEAIARNLPRAGMGPFARGTVAEELSPIDLPGALALLEGGQGDRDRDMHLGHIAHELAGRDPAGAERVLLMIRDVWPNFRDTYTLRACHAMTPLDTGRALRLAAGMSNYRSKARAYGVIALKLAPTDQPAAARLVAEAFAILDRAAEDGKDMWDGLGTACTAAAGLLPIVEEVDPRLLREYLWRTLALRPPLRGSDTRDGIADLSNAQVAAMVARYDREAGRAVLDGFAGRAIDRLRGMTTRDQSFGLQSVFTAAAVVDPAWAVARVEALPGAADPASRDSKTTARLAVAKVLAAEGARRWSDVEWSLLNLWRVGSEHY